MSAAVARALVGPLHVDPCTIPRQLFEELPRLLASEQGNAMSHSEMERELEHRGRELMRALYQSWLDLRAPGEAQEPVVNAAGEELNDQRPSGRDLDTVFGTVRVRRTSYGEKGKASLHPLDAGLNLPPERYSLELRRRAAEEASKSSFDETVQTLAKHTGSPVPKRQVQQLVQRSAQDFDAFYEARHNPADGDRDPDSDPPEAPEPSDTIVVVTADGKGVPMHPKDLRPATRAAAEKEQGNGNLGQRIAGSAKNNRKRMAAVASVYTIAPYVRTPAEVHRALARLPEPEGSEPRPSRPRPQQKRVWASLLKNVEQVLDEAFSEGNDRDLEGTKTWAAVVDGNESQLGALERLAHFYGVQLTIALDIFHVLGYVWKAGRVLAPESDEASQAWVLERTLRILEGHAVHVAAGMRRSATRRGLNDKVREPVDACASYLLKYKKYLHYDQYLAAGLPIASGVIEGACRHLVKDRMELSGARWCLKSSDAVLKIRALRSSGDFDEYWRFHEAREHERNHQTKYSGGQVPKLVPPDASSASRPPRRPGA